MSESGKIVHLGNNVEILCSDYDDIQQKDISFSIYGEFDGVNTIDGQMNAEECGTDDEPVVLIR